METVQVRTHWSMFQVSARHVSEDFWSILTATGAVVLVALLWVALQSAVETMLPEFCEPGVSQVVLRTEFKVVVIKPFDVSGLELDGYTAGCFPHKAVCHIVAVRPSVTTKKHKERDNEITWSTADDATQV